MNIDDIEVPANHPGHTLTDEQIRCKMDQIARNRTSRQLTEHGLYQVYRAILARRHAVALSSKHKPSPS